ncbi:MAG TPA: hypothetical protein VLU43_19030, partial [Anaeromyxobacteraceae bacterium]|nr:hypothetical protein [Anaeromyxobacteraceae bacterium]
IPVIYTYWRQEQVLWERLAALDAPRRAAMEKWATVQKAGWIALAALAAGAAYLAVPRWALGIGLAAAAAAVAAGTARYLALRPAAKRLVWPAGAEAAPLARAG